MCGPHASKSRWVSYSHCKNLVHHNLNPENILSIVTDLALNVCNLHWKCILYHHGSLTFTPWNKDGESAMWTSKLYPMKKHVFSLALALCFGLLSLRFFHSRKWGTPQWKETQPKYLCTFLILPSVGTVILLSERTLTKFSQRWNASNTFFLQAVC